MINFQIYKNSYKEKENEPDYLIKSKSETTGEYVRVGACWLRESEDTKVTEKYFSCSLDVPYKDRSGYKIVEVKGQTVEGDPLAM